MGLDASDSIRLTALIVNFVMTVALFFILWKVIKKPKGPIFSFHAIRVDKENSSRPNDKSSFSNIGILYNQTNFGDRSGYYSYKVKISDPRFPNEEYIGKHNKEEITGLLHSGQYDYNCPINFNNLPIKFKLLKKLTVKIKGNYFNTAKGDYVKINVEEDIPYFVVKSDEVLQVDL